MTPKPGLQNDVRRQEKAYKNYIRMDRKMESVKKSKRGQKTEKERKWKRGGGWKKGKQGGKLLSLCLAAAVVCSLPGQPVRTAAETGSRMRLWYDEPASQTASVWDSNGIWQSATLPIGNGRLGANIYGEVQQEHLTLNEETLWSGGNYNSSNKGGNGGITDEDWNSMVSTILNGGSVDASKLQGAEEQYSGYYDGYQALGDLYFTFSKVGSKTSSYLRELDLEEGLATVSDSGCGYHRTYFVSNPDHVIVARLTGDSLSFTVSMTSKQNGSISAWMEGDQSPVAYIHCEGSVSNNGLLHNTQLAVVAENGSLAASGSTIQVREASAVTVYVTAATDYSTSFFNSEGTQDYYYRTGESAEQLKTRVREVLDGAVSKGYDQVLADHQADYKSLYDTVAVDLGGSSDKTTDALLASYSNSTASASEKRYLETLEYQYGRYLLISGSRENSQLPTTLQGIWNNNNQAPWRSDIHTNINLEMNYWLAGTGNLTSCLKPLCQYMEAMYEPGNRTVQAYTDATSGMMMHTQNTPYGYTCPGWSYSWGWSPSASTWLLQNCYDYYQYTGDRQYLEETLYPLLEKQVAMYDQLLEEKDGKLVFPLSISPEIGGMTYGNTYEQSLIWQLYTDTIEAARVLNKDSGVIQALEDTRSRLYTSFLGNTSSSRNGVTSGSSYIKEWYDENDYVNGYNESDPSHRHISQLLGIFPGSMLGSISGDYETDKAAAIHTLNLRGKNTVSGWSLAQRACTWAALGEGEDAYDYLSTVLTNGVMKNLWGYHDYGGYGGDSKAFQIDANYGYSAAFGEMLLQSNLGYIHVLPALPSVWSSGSFRGLLAEGGFEVSASWENSGLTSLSLVSQKGGSCSLKTAWENISVTCEGQTLDVQWENGIVTFDTTAGSTYQISQGETEPILPDQRASASRDQDGKVNLVWEATEGVTYQIYRREK